MQNISLSILCWSSGLAGWLIECGYFELPLAARVAPCALNSAVREFDSGYEYVEEIVRGGENPLRRLPKPCDALAPNVSRGIISVHFFDPPAAIWSGAGSGTAGLPALKNKDLTYYF